MNLPLYGLAKFEEFMRLQYGIKWIPGTQTGERSRCILQERLIIIREHELRRSAESIEVFCSDKDLMREIEGDFAAWLDNNEGSKDVVTSEGVKG